MVGFSYNVAYTVAANDGAPAEEHLSRAELWQGIERGGRYPGDFADFVVSCDVVSGNRKQFVREIIIGDGAVHTPSGKKIVQDVVIQDGLYVEAMTRDTGAKSTLIVSYGASSATSEEEAHPYLTVFYELKMGENSPKPGSQEAQDIITNYRALAKGICNDSVAKIRGWKTSGKLVQWANEDEILARVNNGV